MTVEFVVGVTGAILGAIGWLYQSYRSLVLLREEHEKMMAFMERVNRNLESLWRESREMRKFYKWAVRQVAMAKGNITTAPLIARVGGHEYSGYTLKELLTKIRGKENVTLSGDFTLPRTLMAKLQCSDGEEGTEADK